MRRYLYLSTAVAGWVMVAGAGRAWAQSSCLVTENCITLGYTETSCPNGNGLRCPFDELYACLGSSVDCSALGYDKTCTGAGEVGSGPSCNGKYASCTCNASYKYTCTGTGYSGGSGEACNGKYTKCTCKSPYTWTSGVCKCPSTYKYTCSGTGYSGGSGTACGGKYQSCTCTSGYNWNGSSCNANPCANQSNGAYSEVYCCNGTVVGVRAVGMDFYVAMNDLGQMNWTNADTQCRAYTFCNKLYGILPTYEQLQSLYNNKSRVNTLLSINIGTKMAEDIYWAIDVNDEGDRHAVIDMSDGSFGSVPSYSLTHVRSILTSW